jgi:hypothetical protein
MGPGPREAGQVRVSVEFRWKEEVVYWEDDRGFVFDGGWGVTPSVTYVPDADQWDRAVAPWMVGRREEILERLAREPGHVLEVFTPPYESAPGWRMITR